MRRMIELFLFSILVLHLVEEAERELDKVDPNVIQCGPWCRCSMCTSPSW